MDRAEYMRLKGELVTASEALLSAQTEKRITQDALQRRGNLLASEKITPQTATEAHGLIDRLLILQQHEEAQAAHVSHFYRALQGVALPEA